jgi:hypothetical protein
MKYKSRQLLIGNDYELGRIVADLPTTSQIATEAFSTASSNGSVPAEKPGEHTAADWQRASHGRKCFQAARLTFANALISICRTRSLEMDNSLPSCSKVRGGSQRRRASNTRLSRSVST